MKFATLAAGALFLIAQVVAYDAPSELVIDVVSKPEGCTKFSKVGDKLSMHYTGTLHKDGSKFDSSLDRKRSFDFTLGMKRLQWISAEMVHYATGDYMDFQGIGQVIKGWDQGLVDMCVGEKRKLTIPARMGYGARAMGSAIPANSALVFDVELLRINGKDEL
ncbi:Peptidyl-prolyl cis-trans isomerase fpr2 [Linnemannia zychae]|nr:Peptidyl-prolyl cis-trans isomerase fpr2 [Linnemannia zychae]